MLEIGMKVYWIGEVASSASFISFLISSADVSPFASLPLVSLNPSLANRFSLTLILLALDLLLLVLLEQAGMSSFPIGVGPAAEIQAFIWKSLSLYD